MSMSAFSKPSLVTRIAVGKAIGLLIGLFGFFLIPVSWPSADSWTRWGVLLWYPTVGAFIGVFGVFSYHPVLRLPLPWWFRAPLIGGWMNFVLVFFAHDAMSSLTHALFGPDSMFLSPFWFVAEGVLVGLLIGWACTKLGGEGEAAVFPRSSPEGTLPLGHAYN